MRWAPRAPRRAAARCQYMIAVPIRPRIQPARHVGSQTPVATCSPYLATSRTQNATNHAVVQMANTGRMSTQRAGSGGGTSRDVGWSASAFGSPVTRGGYPPRTTTAPPRPPERTRQQRTAQPRQPDHHTSDGPHGPANRTNTTSGPHDPANRTTTPATDRAAAPTPNEHTHGRPHNLATPKDQTGQAPTPQTRPTRPIEGPSPGRRTRPLNRA